MLVSSLQAAFQRNIGSNVTTCANIPANCVLISTTAKVRHGSGLLMIGHMPGLFIFMTLHARGKVRVHLSTNLIVVHRPIMCNLIPLTSLTCIVSGGRLIYWLFEQQPHFSVKVWHTAPAPAVSLSALEPVTASPHPKWHHDSGGELQLFSLTLINNKTVWHA